MHGKLLYINNYKKRLTRGQQLADSKHQKWQWMVFQRTHIRG